jgi:glycosyltransferase involved in cell wall biosynthesis
MTSLKIAQVAPLYESVPPKLYGGTERVVSYLTEELVAQGHSVTLFASGDSVTTARLVACCDTSLRLNRDCEDQLVHHIAMLQRVLDSSEQFDVVHFHIDYLHFPLSKLMRLPHLTTLHGRLNIPDLKPLYSLFRDMPVVSISLRQRRPLEDVNWVGNVYHGLPQNQFAPSYGDGKYLAFLGRMSSEKGVDVAIDIAIRSGIPLKIAAKVDKADQEYFDQKLKKLLDHPLIEFIGEISEQEKNEFLGNALALVFPIQWAEPFGLVMIESLACGTPVVSIDKGSVTEKIDHGSSGFVVNDCHEAIRAIRNIGALDRRECRRIFEDRFTAARMARDYLQVYNRVLETNKYDIKIL